LPGSDGSSFSTFLFSADAEFTPPLKVSIQRTAQKPVQILPEWAPRPGMVRRGTVWVTHKSYPKRGGLASSQGT
jgi:hypothetical protein